MAAKFNFENAKEFFKTARREGRMIDEEMLSDELDKYSLNSEQINQVKEFLESMLGIMFTEYTEEIRESVSENGWLKRLTKL